MQPKGSPRKVTVTTSNRENAPGLRTVLLGDATAAVQEPAPRVQEMSRQTHLFSKWAEAAARPLGTRGDIPDYYGQIPLISSSQAWLFEGHIETVGEIKGDKSKRMEWPLRGGPGRGDSGPTFQLPLLPNRATHLSQNGLDFSNSVKMFIVCCPKF